MSVGYQYDRKAEVLIKTEPRRMPVQCSKKEPVWKYLENDGNYMRAIYLGEGCWEQLETITEETAQKLIEEWDVK